METMQEGILIDTGDGTQRIIIKSNLIQQQQQQQPQPVKLTPTGKISHAKTRVYIQRYRKEWEQMDEFKGWLTSSPGETTRAECRYCKKNLHAHRLSLLKHTCTIKHQRAAQLYKRELQAKKLKYEADCKEGLINETTFEEFDLSTLKSSMSDDREGEEEEDNEDYVDNESLEMEENYENIQNDTIVYDNNSDSCVLQVEEEQEIEETNDNNDNNENIDVSIAKIKRELQTDALAQAMAHVHGEYSNDEEIEDEIDDIGDVPAENIEENTEEILPEQIETSAAMDVEITADDGDNKSSENEKSPVKTGNKEAKNPVKTNDSISDVKNSKNNFVQYALNADEFAQIQKSGVTSDRQLVTLGNGQVLRLASGQATTGGQFVLKKVAGNISNLISGTTGKPLRPIAPKSDGKITAISTGGSNNIILQTNLNNKWNSPGKVSTPIITTLVTDTAKGTPLSGLGVTLYKQSGGKWTFLNESTTTSNGRCNDLADKCPTSLGRYKLVYDTEKYYSARKIETHYPFIEIVFDVKNKNGTYHTPLLLSPFGYSTYKSNNHS